MVKKSEEPAQTFKLWTKTLEKLALLRGYTRQSAVSIVDRLVTAELERVEQERKDDEE